MPQLLEPRGREPLSPMSGTHARNKSGSRLKSSSGTETRRESLEVKAGVNPLYGSEITAGSGVLGLDASGAEDEETPSVRRETAHGERVALRGGSVGARGSSPLSSMTTSTVHSTTSSRPGRQSSAGAVAKATRPTGDSGSTSSVTSRSGEKDENSLSMRSEPSQVDAPTLVPAILAPIPPPPRKRKLRTTEDIEDGQRTGEEVMQEAPNKTLMEMLQSYLDSKDMHTRVLLVLLLFVLAGGVFGAYGVLLMYAIRDHKPQYIALCIVFTLALLWVLWKVS